jgi:hypothetical protein
MKINKRIGILSLAATLAVASGCDNYFDINTDPNNPSEVTLGQLLTQSELTIVNSLGIGSNGMSTPTSILVHQTVQRGSVDQYVVTGDDFQIQTAWQNLYSGSLEDLRVIIEQGTEENSPHYVGVAQILTAYTYSMIVDMWGDVPFSAALNPQEALYPQYDDDALVYPALLQLLDQGIANLALESSDSPADDDLIYGGAMDSWRRLAKSLKLKLYNQTRLVADK